MTVQMRGPVTTTTAASAAVRNNAVRLFTHVYLGSLHTMESQDGHHYSSIQSESGRHWYQLDYNPHDETIRCSCAAGQHSIPCKHVELFRLSRGMVVEGRG